MIKLRRPMCLFSVLFVLLLMLILRLSDRLNEDTMYFVADDGQQIEARGILKSISYKNDKLHLYITDISMESDPINSNRKINGLIAYPAEDNNITRLRIGATISVRGKLSCFSRIENEGQYDMRSYYYIRGYDGYLYSADITGMSQSYSIIRDSLYRLRERIKLVYGMYFDEASAGLMEAMVLGDKDELDSDIRSDFANAGISHVLALSGLHIATMGLAVLALLKRLRLNAYLSALVSFIIMVSYCIMTGMTASAVRALIMFIIAVIADLLSRTYDLKTAGVIALDMLLVENPYYMYDSGFLMSFAAVAGIALVYPRLRTMSELLHRRRRRMEYSGLSGYIKLGLVRVFDSILFSLAVQITILPITMYYFYQIPIYGIFLNLIVIPLASILLIAGIAVAVSGYSSVYLSVLNSVTNVIARASARLATWIIGIYRFLSESSLKLKGAVLITGRPTLLRICIYFFVLVLMSMVVTWLAKYKEAAVRNKLPGAYIKRRLAGMTALVTIGLLINLAALIIRRDYDVNISTLSVGQGQCVVLHGSSSPVCVYDCGSTDVNKIGQYRLIPYLKCNAIKNIDFFFVSHMDSDHVNGLIELMSDENMDIAINNIVIPSTAQNYINDNYTELISMAGQRRIPVHTMRTGDVIRSKDVTLSCISPTASCYGADINSGSLMLEIEYNSGRGLYRGVLTGDVTSEVLEDRLNEMNSGYVYCLVPHHGSKSALNGDFYNRTMPLVAVVSAGKNNQYGHPHSEVIKLLDDNHIHTCITYERGQTDLIIDNDRIRLSTMY